jgi:uncharacterized heparinase superfamily protein
VALQLEDSAFFAAIDGTRRTLQIVLTAASTAAEVLWTLRKDVSAPD